MTLTIGIPVYNQAEYLADAIESALAQTVKCEVIVCNDGSTDNSLEVARRYPVKVINQINKGLSSARNSLIMAATGDYFLPLDADDILMENAAERILEAIESTNADVIAPSFKEFGVRNQEIILPAVLPTIEDFKTGNRIGYFSAIKREALLEVGGYSPKMLWGYEDYALWFDLFKRGKTLCILQDILILYRTKERSMIHTAIEHHEELMAQIKKDNPEIFI
jgi:glycosyltransferase involved in cell wall biosynthesis